MKLRHTIFNSIGLALAGIFTLSLTHRLSVLARTNSLPQHNPGGYIFSTILAFMFIFLVGGGGLINLIKGRLLPWPTIGIIVTYCLSIFFLPLGIWGIIELLRNQRPRKQHRSRSSSFSTQFLRRAAMLSWLCSTIGLVLVVLCGSTHNKPLIGLAVLVYAFAVLVSLALGIVALCGVREHGQRGILIPSIFGISISGLVILAFGAALIVGFIEGAGELRQNRTRMTGNTAVAQTNAPPQPTSN